MHVSEDLPLSPPEYLDFHEEADSVDEFFLLPEDILNVDFETVCEELARFSYDMEIILNSSEHNSSYLKAAKASDEWNTLWIYRGRLSLFTEICTAKFATRKQTCTSDIFGFRNFMLF